MVWSWSIFLSPSRINYFTFQNTLVEEHIAGIPGDQFMLNYLHNSEFNKVRIAKEFVKFNERCFVRLLGDMRSYNYVFDITPDFEEVQFRLRAIDFDQQSYEGKRTIYLPQFFKENLPLVQLTLDLLTPATIRQYQKEETNADSAKEFVFLLSAQSIGRGDEIMTRFHCLIK
jgi:hypothetical protein